jgi:hypothetical protein
MSVHIPPAIPALPGHSLATGRHGPTRPGKGVFRCSLEQCSSDHIVKLMTEKTGISTDPDNWGAETEPGGVGRGSRGGHGFLILKKILDVYIYGGLGIFPKCLPYPTCLTCIGSQSTLALFRVMFRLFAHFLMRSSNAM